ncbi:hypothetical protein [Campylobacter gastrosuis]|uniref:Uncharacterized protein n=1 Tax=Campylobacter gastrosuis TaxID=2974576 RepID=A0ABT7HRV2_9BACT|nr:hypothetical protein [Campylobacter gastrosuis]MDL0089462.1 hypothetical protein [Campylobacter gastrosuis]
MDKYLKFQQISKLLLLLLGVWYYKFHFSLRKSGCHPPFLNS